jgi:SAM-dependent methyltransferase
VVVELLGDIAPFLSENQDSVRVTLDDSRITYFVDDGRRFLNRYPQKKFDLISIDPLYQHTAGHNNLYSEEAMQIYLDHLSPGGVLCAWIDEYHVIPHTVARVFPYVDKFRNELLVASNQSIHYSKPYMDEATFYYKELVGQIYEDDLPDYPSTDKALSRLGADRNKILEVEKSTPYLIDLKPRLEYYLLRKPIE